MLKLAYNPDRNSNFILACSGGSDSMAAADFFHRGNKSFAVAYFNHGTSQADAMEQCVKKWCQEHNRKFLCEKISSERGKDTSPEEHWRNERYKFLNSFGTQIVMAHNLDDAVETWIFSSLHGNSKLMPFKNGNVFRPFILNEKEKLTAWCIQHNVKWFEDKSNTDLSFPRNRIRHSIIPECLKINPGLKKVIKKKLLDQLK